MSRLTDDQIATLLSNARQNDGQVEQWLDLRRSVALLEEIQDRRAQDLSDEERDALDWLLRWAPGAHIYGTTCIGDRNPGQVALAALTRLLQGGR